MEPPIDIRTLDEWMYALNAAAAELDECSESVRLMRRVLDDMRERRAQLRLWRHNEVGY